MRKTDQRMLAHDSALSTIGAALTDVRGELDDYREHLNEETNEIHSLYEYIRNVEGKLDRALSRIDELTLLVRGKKPSQKWAFTPLTAKEKDVFQVLYTLTASRPFVSYKDLAAKLNLSKQLVSSYITVLIQKGIPVEKKYQSSQVFVRLHPEFRQAQAKHNLVGVNTLLTYWT